MTEKNEITMQLKQILIYFDYHALNMQQNVMIQIITEHLNGKSLREIAIIEYTDKKTMKIIDGREYENAQEIDVI